MLLHVVKILMLDLVTEPEMATPKNHNKKLSIDSSKELDHIVNDLRSLGFSDYEARAYIGLLKCGPATAYEVAKVSGLPRANVYNVLKTLTEKGASQPVNEKPVRYMPVSPDEVFKSIAENTSQLCTDLRDRLSSMVNEEGLEYVWIIKGESDFLRKSSEMIQTAQKHVWLKGTDTYVSLLLPEIRKACKRGISVAIIVFAESTEPFQCDPNCQVFLHEGNGVILGGAANFLTITVDSDKSLIAKVTGDLEAAYSENYSFVYMVDLLIKHEIYVAEIMNRFRDEIEKEFGPGLVHLRSKYSRPQLGSIFEKYVQQRSAELQPK